MSNVDEKPTKDLIDFPKTLGVKDGIAILIGITIGAGIYSTPNLIARYQTSFWDVIGLWILAGVFVFIGGLIYAELGSRLPKTGGEYVYISRAFGPFAGFIFGWAQLFIIRTSPVAGLSLIVVKYLQTFVELSPVSEMIVCIVLILCIGVLNYVGIRRASLFQIASTIFKVGGLLALVIAGLILVQGETNLLGQEVPVDPDIPLTSFGLFSASMMLIVFTYLGWDRVGYSAGEMKNPKRTIPVSIFWGISIVIVVYLLANLLYHYALGIEGMRTSERVATDTATLLFGTVGAGLVAIMVMISASGSINGTMMTAPRVYYAMAKDKLFFNWFAYIHPKFHTPSRAIIAQCAWSIVILLVRANFENIVAGMVFAILIFYVVTTLSYFKLRFQKVGGEDVLTIPIHLPCIYLVGLITLILIRGFYEWEKSIVDLAFVATGIPFAFIFAKAKRSEESPKNIQK